MDDLPDGFLWGTGASSTQTEGAAAASDWARWERLGRAPASGEGNGFATRFREDFALLGALGLTQHRLSLEWARLEPREGEHDPAAVEHYREVLAAGADAGVEVWACLHHFTLPGWFSDDLGGFLDDRGLGYFWPRHVDWVAETFGDLVAGWKPVNEPLAYAAGGFLLGAMPPGRADAGDFADALRASHLANLAAWRLLRGGDQPVATVMNLSPVRSGATSTDTGATERAREWGRLVDDAYWGCWISLLRDGIWRNPLGGTEEVPDAAGAFDLIGFSYYSTVSVDQDGVLHPYPSDARRGPLGDARHPDGLRECLERLADELPGRRLLISEVGLGTPAEDPRADEERCEYMEQVVGIVTEAVRAGIDLAGLFWWTGIDNYEWLHGFDAQFGLVDAGRQPRRSAELAAGWASGR
jgi:beta-glucosidase